MNVSEKIRYYRELRGLTQQQLADFSGIPLGTLKKYETGNRNPKQEPLQRIYLLSPKLAKFSFMVTKMLMENLT